MYDLIICSFFKDSQNWHGHQINQVHRYFSQLHDNINNCLDEAKNYKIYAIEGNSSDDTRKVLESYKKDFNLEIIDDIISKESPVESTAAGNRLATLNKLGNFMLENVKGKAKDYLWLESDLIIPDSLVSCLVDGFFSGYSIVAPVITWQTMDIFYDLWAFVNPDGTQWTQNNHNDYIDEGRSKGLRFKEMNSIGSSAMIRGEIINKGINFGDNCFRGLCENSIKNGYKVAVDLETTIWHPSQALVKGRMI